jgi:hypothetical protein
MRVFHGRVESANEEAKASALRRLGEALQGLSKRALAREDFERFEREVHALFNAAEREVLAEELARLDVDLPHVDIGGVCHHRVLRSTETYLSAVGPLTVERTLYRAGRAPAVVPGGAARRHRRGAVDGPGGPPGGVSGGARDPAGGRRGVGRARQHDALEEQP